ncbi:MULTISPECIES: hypothetical protein [Burkholderia]|uniref:hypothetical protein n=1 Tax=Burkholderia TaxID=32008 RepID=UPI000327F88E|nr:hypothetical protein [Burkholderia humptydooensis]AGK51086.1 hypothetical protein BTI_4677 [Burkholderia thailandensis MSMB121]ATF33819.1 hypothetical protein CO709_11350 [Burkholderia thailandensis]KVN06757.1 hypothetical protein WT08_19970 [Burkholderia sp. MSMB1552]KWZ50021.1 hypothetical protein WS92_21415 [Burkholderia sp. MSMB1588]KST71902.1 hypothetical protein WS76_25600 [Burkholderia humptydooensis]
MIDADRGRSPVASLMEKVARLREPATWPDGAHAVTAIETHMSWVFLTDRHAWKLKKPVRASQLDFRSLAARARFCHEEVRLNRRLAADVYLDAVPLTIDSDGRLRPNGAGEIVDWLVEMKRLPAERMLDRALLHGTATRADARRVAERLSAFYRSLAPARGGADLYRDGLRRTIDCNERALRRPMFEQPVEVVRAVCVLQRALLDAEAARFDARVRQGRIVEGHGDLRPEHVCIDAQIAIIDCLEFSRRLRTQDMADEIGFLALECERLGAPDFARALLDEYRAASGDAVDDALVHFYQSCRAMTRARLAAWHLREKAFRATPVWRDRARAYVALAQRHAGCCERLWTAARISAAAGP